jgi:hypothetical protein
LQKKTFKLFKDVELKNILKIDKNLMKNEIEAELKDKILNISENEISEKYYRRYHYEPLIVNVDKISKSKNIDKKLKMLIHTFCIPFTGNPDYLQFSSTLGIIGWTLNVYLKKNCFCFEKKTYISSQEDFKEEIEEVVGVIRQETEKINMDIENYNLELINFIKKILKDKMIISKN